MTKIKDKENNKKRTKKDEFRKNKDTGHPAYIYAKIGNELKYIGITHSEITQGVKNIKLDKNPNPKDKKSAYARPKSERAKTSRFGKKKKDWKLSKKDKEKLEPLKK